MAKPTLWQAFVAKWREGALILINEIPLLMGIALIVIIHLGRAKLLTPSGGDDALRDSVWTPILNAGSLVAEWTLITSLVANKGIDLAGELVEAVLVRILRVAELWRTGRKPKG